MSTLSFQIERYIVKQLACEVDPETIAEEVKRKFLREVDHPTIRLYCPEADGSALRPDLRDLYQITRWEYEGVAEDPDET